MTEVCRTCRAPMAPGALFCGACGTASRRHVRASAARDRRERGATSRAALGLGCACAGTLFGLVGSSGNIAVDDTGWSEVLLGSGVVFAAALAAALVAGVLQTSLPLRSSPGWLLAAFPTAVASLAAAIVYTSWMPATYSEAPWRMQALWIGMVVLAPIGEEWLCRGVAWRAALVLAPPRTTLLVTSVLFAFLHGLVGSVLALPHRFVAGLLFGWLRWRSGSVLPGMLAHALHNAACLIWLDG